MADIDFFKSINDTYGHDFGDVVIKEVSDIMVQRIGTSHGLARWGGEEFLILLKDTDLAAGALLMEQIRWTMEAHVFRMGDVQTAVTMTFGGAAYTPGDNINDVIKKADSALYHGKNTGRNRVVTECTYSKLT